MNLQFPHEKWRTLPSEVWSHVLDLLTPAEVNWLLLGTSGDRVVPADSVNSAATDLRLRTPYWLENRHRFINAKLKAEMDPRMWLCVPSDAWNCVLDFLRVSEVDRLLLSTSGQVVPDDAVNYTAKVVNLVKPSCFATADRFRGAELVRIPCLATYPFLETQTTNKNVAEKILPLVTKMNRLETLDIGAKCIDMGEWSPPVDNENADILSSFRYCDWKCGDRKSFDVASFRLLVGGFVDCFRDGKLSSIRKLRLVEYIMPQLCGGHTGVVVHYVMTS